MKHLLIVFLILLSFLNLRGQNIQIGTISGFTLMTGKSEADGFGQESQTEAGFHFGIFFDIELSDKISLQPELTYESAEGINYINFNPILKFSVVDKFNLLAGPQVALGVGEEFNFLSDALPDDFTALNLRLALGASYDISDNYFIQARYGFQLNDHITVDEVSLTFNVLNIGFGYRF
jgi:opacity protein-like surface antigen